MRRALLAGVVLAAGVTTSACGSSADCTDASAITSMISRQMTDGTSAGAAQAVKSTEFQNVWLVAVKMSGPGVDGQTAVFAVNSLTAPSSVKAVDSVAQAFSKWPSGAAQGLSSTSAGVEDAIGCL